MNSFKTLTDLSCLIDHTVLQADTPRSRIISLCEEAVEHSFFSVCVNPFYVPLACEILKNSSVKVATVSGFPLGSTLSRAKAYESAAAVRAGAQEVDMVLSISALKDGDQKSVLEDIQAVKEACEGALLKVILETALLNDDQIVLACRLAKEAGADFVKTSTGFSTKGATLEGVSLMRKTVGPKIGVKASGGIKTLDQAQQMVNAGANRLGTSSGVALMKELKEVLRC